MPSAPSRVAPCSTLYEKTSHWFERAAAAQLGQLPCQAGCSRCCIGTFPVTILDQATIQEGLATFSDTQRLAIQKRAIQQATALTAAFPALAATPFVDRWSDEQLDRLAEQFADLPCPALDDNGRCTIYPFRPLTCRSMGIPSDDAECVTGACDVQTAVPIVRLSGALREEEERLAAEEATCLAALHQTRPDLGEEMPLPFAFLPQHKSEIH